MGGLDYSTVDTIKGNKFVTLVKIKAQNLKTALNEYDMVKNSN